MNTEQIKPGDEITVEYTDVSPLSWGRTSKKATVSEASGQVLYTEPVMDDIILIVDPDGRVWARDDGIHDDGLVGKHAEIVA